MNCELCGREAGKLIFVEIEGTEMKACVECAKFGKEIQVKRQAKVPTNVGEALQKRARRIHERDIYTETGKEELAFDYSERIRKARNVLGLTQEELGKKINEKKSIITKLESGHIRPDNKTLKKLERALNINLKEHVQKVKVKTHTTMRTLTIADLIKK